MRRGSFGAQRIKTEKKKTPKEFLFGQDFIRTGYGNRKAEHRAREEISLRLSLGARATHDL
jgi:hypothetical protein